MLSGRAATRAMERAKRRKGAGWTRKFRKGREQRHPFQEKKEVNEHETLEQA